MSGNETPKTENRRSLPKWGWLLFGAAVVALLGTAIWVARRPAKTVVVEKAVKETVVVVKEVTKIVEVTQMPAQTPSNTPEPTEPTVAATPKPAEPTQIAKANWPSTPAQAASLFGGDASRWEPTADCCGWHLREESTRILISPSGFALEGYYDQKPGRDPRQFVSVAAVEVQGTTVWNATAQELFCAMVAAKKTDPSNIDAIGFTKPSCQ